MGGSKALFDLSVTYPLLSGWRRIAKIEKPLLLSSLTAVSISFRSASTSRVNRSSGDQNKTLFVNPVTNVV